MNVSAALVLALERIIIESQKGFGQLGEGHSADLHHEAVVHLGDEVAGPGGGELQLRWRKT